ncbi:MAG: hypothetical protein ACRDAM_08885 [Casimicrobium sp.]
MPPPIIPVVPRAPVVVQQATREQFNEAARSPSERQQQIAGLNELLPEVFGMDRVGAKVTAVVSSGNRLLVRNEWCGGNIDAVNAVLIDNVVPPSGVLVANYTGTQTVADSALVSAYAANSVTYGDTLAGVAYTRLSVPSGVTTGFPRAVGEIRGRRVRTSSGGPLVYTTNFVWHIGYLLTDVVGAAINWASFTSAATEACDALVGGEKKREFGLAFEEEQSVWDVIRLLLGYVG